MTPLLLLGLPAMAFQPSEDVHIGREPYRVRRVHAERQYALRHGAAWQGFASGAGAGWQVVFDEWTGMPARAWGPGIELGALTDSGAVEAALRNYIGEVR